MATKEVFFIGDNPTLIFESRKPDPYRFEDSDGVPANPIKAEYRLYNKTSAELFEIGRTVDPTTGETITGKTTFGVDDNYITIEPENPDEDRGAIIYVRFPTELTTEPGAYTLYLSSIFEDGQKITDNYRIDILEYK